MKVSQSMHSQAAEVTRLVKVAFPTLADADRQARTLEYFSSASESKIIQRRLLAVAPTTIKKAKQGIEEYLAVGLPEQTAQAMSVKQTELPVQPPVLEVSLRATAEAVTQQTMLLEQVLEKRKQKPVRQEPGCFKCGGPHMQQYCPQGN